MNHTKYLQHEILYLVDLSEKFRKNPHLSRLPASGVLPTTFEGWTLTKQLRPKIENASSWAFAIKTKIEASQDELRTLVAKQTMREQSITEQHDDPNMKSSEKHQADLLLQERNKEETNSRFVYKLALLRFVQGITERTTGQITAMQIILKRVYSPDNEKQYTTRSEQWSNHATPIYPAAEVCISPLEIPISSVLVILKVPIVSRKASMHLKHHPDGCSIRREKLTLLSATDATFRTPSWMGP